MLLTRKIKLELPCSEGQLTDVPYNTNTTALTIPAANAPIPLVSGIGYLLKVKAMGINSAGVPEFVEMLIGVPGPAALATMTQNQVIAVGVCTVFANVDVNGDIIIEYRHGDFGLTHSTIVNVEVWLLGP